MKKLLFALTCLAMLVSVPACKPKNEPQNPNDNWDNPYANVDDSLLTSWEKCRKHVRPGIYQGLTDEELNTGTNMGYDKVILAVCEDGSAFYCKLSEGSVIAPITCYDGNLTFTKVTGSEPTTGNYQYDKDITVCSREALTIGTHKTYDIATQLELWASTYFGFDKYFYQGTMIEKYFRRIDDAPNFNATYEKVFKRAIKKGGYVPFNDLFTASHTIYGDGWHNELYPESMNTQRWVVPYDGNDRIERFAVYRQRNWGYDSRWYMFYSPCNWELVTWVECDVACDSEEALRWKAKITAMTDRYNEVSSSKTAETEYVIGYGFDTNDEDVDLDGYKGYIRPTYEMQWMKNVNTWIYGMSIKFGVAWTTYV